MTGITISFKLSIIIRNRIVEPRLKTIFLKKSNKELSLQNNMSMFVGFELNANLKFY